MKIAVDGRPLQGQLTGIGKFTLHVVRRLAEVWPESKIVVFTNKPLAIDLSCYGNLEVVYDSAFSRIKPLVWTKFFLGRLIRKDNFDFCFFGATFTPIRQLPGKTVVIVHDLNYLLVGDTMSTLHYFTNRLFFKRDIMNADVVISNSRGTADKLLAYSGIRTHGVLHPPVSQHYRVMESDEIQPILRQLGVPEKYILSVATFEPRKNLEKTIQAFQLLRSWGALEGYHLVLAGGDGWRNDRLNELISGNSEIIKLGYVEEASLPSLYNGAGSFVFPSKYEGYGMPPVEAMMCGIKPVVSDIPELREATADGAFFIQPDNIKEYAQAIIESIAFNLRQPQSRLIDAYTIFEEQFRGFLSLLRS